MELLAVRLEVSALRFEVSGTRYKLLAVRCELLGLRYEVSGIRYELLVMRWGVFIASSLYSPDTIKLRRLQLQKGLLAVQVAFLFLRRTD